MTMFESRERAFEAKFAHDQEFRFLVTARRDKLMAGRVADRLAMPDDARDELLAAVLALRDGPGHDALLIQHVAGVLQEHGHGAPAIEVAGWLADCATQAQGQLLQEPLH
jgi:hypothetical protein